MYGTDSGWCLGATSAHGTPCQDRPNERQKAQKRRETASVHTWQCCPHRGRRRHRRSTHRHHHHHQPEQERQPFYALVTCWAMLGQARLWSKPAAAAANFRGTPPLFEVPKNTRGGYGGPPPECFFYQLWALPKPTTK